MELTEIIAQNIQKLLAEKKVTISELSQSLGISRVTMGNYLRANTTIDSVRLVQIANYFGVSPERLLTKQQDGRPAILFRSALYYQDALDEVEERITQYLDQYVSLAKSVGKSLGFLPEQYNLFTEYKGEVIDINFSVTDAFDAMRKIEPSLKQEIWQIADYHRQLLGMGNKGAIDLIPALTARGVNVVFLDLGSSEISGLSICDESYGSFIFVNSNSSITYERQLFTIAHEYGHILLHRPVFRQRAAQDDFEKKRDFLDKMANCFAGRLLCPPQVLQPYISQFAADNENISYVISVAMPIKQQLQISLQSLIMALDSYDMIQKEVTNKYFEMLRQTDTMRIEPLSFAENKALQERFISEREAPILRMLRAKAARNQLKREEIQYFIDCTWKHADEIYHRLENEKDTVRKMFEILPNGDMNS